MRLCVVTVLCTAAMLAACGLSVVGSEVLNADAGLPDSSATTPPEDSGSLDAQVTDASAPVSLDASASVVAPDASLDLSALGNEDWVDYGAVPLERKADRGILGVYTTTADAGAVFADAGGATCVWSDGTPTRAMSTSSFVVFLRGNTDLVFTVPVKPTAQVFTLNLGGYGGKMAVEADLGGQTALTTINDDTTSLFRFRYTLTFSGAPSQTLTVKLKLGDCGAANCDQNHFFAFDAATLSTN